MKQGVKDSKGASAVEFALILPLFLLIVFGIIEWSLYLFNDHIITNASREGARRATLFTSPRGPVDVENEVLSYTSDHLVTFDTAPTAPSITVSPEFCATSGESISVTVTYTYTFLLLPTLTAGKVAPKKIMAANTVMRCE